MPEDGQLRKLTEQHRQTCDNLQGTEDALPSSIKERCTMLPRSAYNPALTTCK